MNRFLSRWREALRGLATRRDVDRLLLAIGRQESRTVRAATYRTLAEAEFRVFSQWGEDGILQYLLGKVPVASTVFVEIGVQDYSESNTRFLLQNDNWGGLIVDCDRAHVEFAQAHGLDWRHELTAAQAFVTRDNVNRVIAQAGLRGDIGLLSLDIDGNDYWVLDALDVVSPRILVVEYNSVLGPELAVTIPYTPDFDRRRAHPSTLYYGASLAALCLAAERKGYELVGSNSAGNNAFFVRRDVLGGLAPVPPREAWVASRFRESRDASGAPSHVSGHLDRLRLIADLPLVQVPGGRERRVRELYDL